MDQPTLPDLRPLSLSGCSCLKCPSAKQRLTQACGDAGRVDLPDLQLRQASMQDMWICLVCS